MSSSRNKKKGEGRSEKKIVNEKEDCEEDKREENEIKVIRKQIGELERLLARVQSAQGIVLFKDVILPESAILDENEGNTDSQEQSFHEMMNAFTNNIPPIADVTCKIKDEQSTVFAFHNFNANSKEDSVYTIQLDVTDDGWTVNNYFLPMFMDIDPIVKKHKLDNARSVKNFLKDIKRLIETRKSREAQFTELQNYLEELDLYDCTFEKSSMDCTKMTLKLVRNLPKKFSPSRIILCSIYFEPDETAPSRIMIDCAGSTPLDDDEESNIETLMNYFLKIENLKKAAKKIFEKEPDMWLKNSSENDMEIEMEEPRESSKSKRGKKRNIRETEEERAVEEKIARVKSHEEKISKKKIVKKGAGSKTKSKKQEERGNRKIQFDKSGRLQLADTSTPIAGISNPKRIFPKDLSDIANSD